MKDPFHMYNHMNPYVPQPTITTQCKLSAYKASRESPSPLDRSLEVEKTHVDAIFAGLRSKEV
jgi:hypothetical protein